MYTPENERMSPKNGLFQWEIHLPTIDFHGTFVRFQGSRRLTQFPILKIFQAQICSTPKQQIEGNHNRCAEEEFFSKCFGAVNSSKWFFWVSSFTTSNQIHP